MSDDCWSLKTNSRLGRGSAARSGAGAAQEVIAQSGGMAHASKVMGTPARPQEFAFDAPQASILIARPFDLARRRYLWPIVSSLARSCRTRSGFF